MGTSKDRQENAVRQPNLKLRLERKRRGWGQKTVAVALNVSTAMVSKWECGEREPSPFYQEKLCSLFKKTAEELGFTDTFINGLPIRPQPSSIRAFSDTLPLEQNETKPSVSVFLPPHMFLDSELLSRLERVFQAPSQIDQTTLEYLRRLVSEQKRQLVQGGGVNWYEFLSHASHHLRLFTNLLETTSGKTSRELVTLIAEISLLIGDVLFNTGDAQTSLRYYDMSLQSAHEAQNGTLLAIALGRYGLLFIDLQQSPRALVLLDEAISLANLKASSAITSWLWAVKGEAYASIGEEKDCQQAIETSRDLLERKEEKEAYYTFIGELAASVYGPSKLLGYEGASYLRLKQPERAQRVLLVSQQSSSHPHHQSLVNADFALSLTQQNAPKEACSFAVQSLKSIELTRSIRAFQRVLSVRKALRPWRDISEIRDLDERIRLIGQSLQV